MGLHRLLLDRSCLDFRISTKLMKTTLITFLGLACVLLVASVPITVDKTVEDSHHDAVNNKLTQDVELAEPVRVLPGWCRNWKHQNTGESERMTGQRTYFTGENVTQASCIARCNEHAGCHQAVFEASGPWGPQCWLGHQASTARPTDSRPCSGHSTPCVDFCYNKEGYVRIASDPDHVLPGWCRNWRHQNTGESMRMTGQRTYFTGNTVTLKTCMAKCHENASCKQAVFEASGHWGPQCWLGTQASSARPTGSRPCSKYPNEPCVDFCFSKSGWATMEEQQLQSTVDDLLDVQ